jgi:hypothetical protein
MTLTFYFAYETLTTQVRCVPDILQFRKPKRFRIFQTPSIKERMDHPPMKKGQCYRQNHLDSTNLRILNFADNKVLYGGELSKSLTSAPVIDGTKLEMKTKPLLPTHSSDNVCLCTLDFKPRLAIRLLFFAPPIILLLLPLVLTFLPPLSFSLLHDVKRTNERADERTNGNSPLLMSCSSLAYHY